MITIKTAEEIETLRLGGALLAEILGKLKDAARSGVTTKALSDLAERLILAAGGEPSFKGYNPFGASVAYPAALCVSLNDEVVHAVPKETRLIREGDLVSLDIGMWWPGKALREKEPALRGLRPMATDTALTIAVGDVSPQITLLVRATQEALAKGIQEVKPGARIGDIGAAIQAHIEKHGFGVIRDLAGHGVGYKVHEDPFVPNFGARGTGSVLREGMVLAIEPMAAEGTWRVTLDADEWTFRTADGSRAAHFEHTVAVAPGGSIVVTSGI